MGIDKTLMNILPVLLPSRLNILDPFLAKRDRQHRECQQCPSSSFICGWYHIEKNILKHQQFYF